jgi:ribosome recycling factor
MKDIILIENETKSFEEPMNAEMQKVLSHFEGELIKIRTGRAHTSLVEDIMVECYDGSPMPMKNLAAISAPESRLIVIQPWDTTTLPAIEKALKASEIGITPQVDGKLIRLRLPEMSTTRRDELAKILGRKLEDCKVGARNVRKDFNNLIRDAKKDKRISENFFNRLSDSLESITGKWIGKAEQLAEKKEAEIKSF